MVVAPGVEPSATSEATANTPVVEFVSYWVLVVRVAGRPESVTVAVWVAEPTVAVSVAVPGVP